MSWFLIQCLSLIYLKFWGKIVTHIHIHSHTWILSMVYILETYISYVNRNHYFIYPSSQWNQDAGIEHFTCSSHCGTRHLVLGKKINFEGRPILHWENRDGANHWLIVTSCVYYLLIQQKCSLHLLCENLSKGRLLCIKTTSTYSSSS